MDHDSLSPATSPAPGSPAPITSAPITSAPGSPAPGSPSSVTSDTFTRTARVADVVRRDPDAYGPGVAMLQAACMGA